MYENLVDDKMHISYINKYIYMNLINGNIPVSYININIYRNLVNGNMIVLVESYRKAHMCVLC